jgi:hypothetical protein
MQWIKGKDIVKPGSYWRCWRGANSMYYKVGIEYIEPKRLDACKDLGIVWSDSEYQYYYGPLEIEMPPPPTGDVWGV